MKRLIGTANLLAGQAVALAEGFLDGRGLERSDKVAALFEDLNRLRDKTASDDLDTRWIVDSAKMLLISLRSAETAFASGVGDDRWLELVKWLCDHVRKESLALIQNGLIA